MTSVWLGNRAGFPAANAPLEQGRPGLEGRRGCRARGEGTAGMPSQRGGDGGDAEPEGRGRRGCRARGEGTAGMPSEREGRDRQRGGRVIEVEARGRRGTGCRSPSRRGRKSFPNGTDLGPPTVPGPAAVHALPRHPEQPCCGPIFPARALLASLPGQSPPPARPAREPWSPTGRHPARQNRWPTGWSSSRRRAALTSRSSPPSRTTTPNRVPVLRAARGGVAAALTGRRGRRGGHLAFPRGHPARAVPLHRLSRLFHRLSRLSRRCRPVGRLPRSA